MENRTERSLLVSVGDAATLLSVSRWTIRRLIDKGDLALVRLPGASGNGVRRLLVDRNDVLRLIERCKEFEDRA